jgi:aminoglycoside phosphotransferase (APT) family kinase protein
VLDWEVATLGDPLADLAYLLNRWTAVIAAPAMTDYLSTNEMIDRYRAKTGAPVDNLNYYIAFNYWKAACIIHGVYTRYVRGQKSSHDVDLDAMRARIAISVEQAAEAASLVS